MGKSKIEFVELESKILRGNPLGDPHTRRFPVYLPPGYDGKQKYPVIYGLTGFSGTGDYYVQKRTFRESIDQILDHLILNEKVEPFIYVMPTCVTYYGGSQYVNSSSCGNYEDYFIQELLPFIDQTFASNERRAIMGGSSGGIGAFTLGAKYPNLFSAIANHSGDSAFEYCYFNDIPNFVSYMEKFEYNVKNFIQRLGDPTLPKDNAFMGAANLLCMCACYLPNPQAELGFDLPFDIRDGEIDKVLWEKMSQHDPVVFVSRYQENLKKIKHIHIDCGKRDQFHLHLGARRLHKKMQNLQIDHHYEEYDSDHFLMRLEQKKKSIAAIRKFL